LALGVANQLTNILRDVGEDMRERNRIYIPLDELAKFNITEEELMSGMHCTSTGKMDDRYVQFTQYMVRVLSTLLNQVAIPLPCTPLPRTTRGCHNKVFLLCNSVQVVALVFIHDISIHSRLIQKTCLYFQKV
jgi:hypothetical protein